MNTLMNFFDSLRKRKKAFLRLVVLLVVNAVLFGAVTYRIANKQERLAGEQEQLTFELSQKAAELEAVSKAQSQVGSNTEEVDTFWSDVVQPRVPGLTEAWDEIDRLASETGVTRGRTGYDREILDVGLEQIKASMPVEGDYFNLVRFINRLERSERFFLVEEIQLSQRDFGDDVVRLNCSISFYLRRPGEGGEAAGS